MGASRHSQARQPVLPILAGLLAFATTATVLHAIPYPSPARPASLLETKRRALASPDSLWDVIFIGSSLV